MQTAAAIRIYDGSDSNPCRFEDADAAVRSGRVLKNLWQGHAHFRTVEAYPLLDDKLAAVRRVLSEFE
jgi:hypothetical protein